MDRGELPALRSLVESGVSGNLATLEPQLSPMLWTSIATGKMAYHHGVAGFTEVDPASGQVVPVSAATRKCKTLWEMLGERGLKSHVVGWFATQGERDLNGCMVSNLFPHLADAKRGQSPADFPPPPPGTYWPENLAEELNELRVSPCEIDPDEILRLFVPLASEVDQSSDRRLALLAERLAEAYSIQAAATWLMEERPEWDFMAIYFRAIDEISHIFMPFHPPQMEGVPDRDFEIYQHVISITYRAHDLMLQRLLDLAGPETAVMLISDHGFHSDHLRPRSTPNVPAGITVWHRPQGTLAAKGPGFRQDALVHGARLLDIAPTILHWFGLPAGQDMEGRVLEEIFSEQRPIATLPSWENGKGSEKRRSTLNPQENRELLDQFVKLGYIDEISSVPTMAAAETQRENSWNLARACLYGGRLEEALPLLEDCHFGFPERSDHAQLLARCQLQLGLLDEAEGTAQTALATAGHRGAARLIQAYIALERNENARALQLLEIVREEEPEAPLLLHYLSRAYLALKKWREAEGTARRILSIDPDNVQGHLVLTRCLLRQNRIDEAIETALDAIAREYANPAGHFLLATALLRNGDTENAETALRRTISLNGRFLAAAHRLLAGILGQRGDAETSSEHYLRSRLTQRLRHSVDQANLGRLRREIAARAEMRISARRRERETALPENPATESLDLLIVSGLPRSGTSLMMQILEAGGIEPMTDGLRTADNDNPEGYYEWEAVKSLPQHPHLIEQAEGKVTKVISALLPHLPPRHHYKVVFMTRPAAQIARSQQIMLRNLGEPAEDAEKIESTLASHAEKILSRLRVLPNIDLLEVPYPELVSQPEPWLERLTRFLPGRFTHTTDFQTVVRPDLFRNR